MPCRITTASDEIEPMNWEPYPLASASKTPTAYRPETTGAVPGPSPAAEALALKQRIQQLEQARPLEAMRSKQEGIAEGLQQGRTEFASQLKAVSDRLTATIAELATLKRKLRNGAEREILDLSLAIARRILYRELVTDPEALQGLLHVALQKLQQREITRIRVYPEGADAIRAGLQHLGAAPAIQVYADQSLKAGSVIFETALGELDASIDTQLAEIQRGFADRLKSQ
jgi:flagellar assembly protein FliH